MTVPAHGGQPDTARDVVGVDAAVLGHQHRVLDNDDRLETTGLDVSREGGHPFGVRGDPGSDGRDDGEFHGSRRPLLRRIASQHCSRSIPVCCIHIRVGDSSSVGSGVSVGSVVTVGLWMVPGCNDQTVVPLGCSVEQYAVVPWAVVAVLPTDEQLAPITATGGATGVVAIVVGDASGTEVGGGCTGSGGGGGSGVNAGLGGVGGFTVAVLGASGRSARRNSMSATVIAAISSTAR